MRGGGKAALPAGKVLLAYQDAPAIEAYDDLEFADDMRCVAVPVLEKGGSVASGISLSGPISRYTPQRLRELRDIALEVARGLSRRLGGAA